MVEPPVLCDVEVVLEDVVCTPLAELVVDVPDEEVMEEDLIVEELATVEETDEVDDFDVVFCVELDGEELPESA